MPQVKLRRTGQDETFQTTVSFFFECCAAWVERNEAIVLLGMLALLFWSLLVYSAAKPFWYDEIFTVSQMMRHGLADMTQGASADGNPPTLAIFGKLFARFFGVTTLAARFPSILAYVAMAGVVFRTLRLRTSATGAFVAVAYLCVSPALDYGAEARPYAFVLLGVSVAFYGWFSASQQPATWRRRGLLYIAAGIAFCISSHHLGILNVGLGLFAAEAVRTWQRRRLDVPMVMSGLAGLLPVLWTYPMMVQTHMLMGTGSSMKKQPAHWLGGTKGMLVFYWDHLDGLHLFIFAIAICLGVVWCHRRRLSSWPLADMVAIGTTTLMPYLVWVVTQCTTRYYPSQRYGIAWFVGLAMALTVSLDTFRPSVRLLAILFLMSPVTHNLKRPKMHVAYMSEVGNLPPGEVVVASPLRYCELWWQAPPTLRKRIHYLADLQYSSVREGNIMERLFVAQKPYLPMKVDDYNTFLKDHPTFYLLHTDGPWQYVWDRLREDRHYNVRRELMPEYDPEGNVFTVSRR